MPGADLVVRVREALSPLPVTEQKMFGGVCFMLNGNMLVGASPRGLMVRVGKEGHDAAVARPHARPMEQGARTMVGYVVVDPKGVARARDLKSWLDLAAAHVAALPPKEKNSPPARTAAKPASRPGRRPA